MEGSRLPSCWPGYFHSDIGIAKRQGHLKGMPVFILTFSPGLYMECQWVSCAPTGTATDLNPDNLSVSRALFLIRWGYPSATWNKHSKNVLLNSWRVVSSVDRFSPLPQAPLYQEGMRTAVSIYGIWCMGIWAGDMFRLDLVEQNYVVLKCYLQV